MENSETTQYRVGDPDPTPNSSPCCRREDDDFLCTLEPGHAGRQHVAGDGVAIVHVWADEVQARTLGEQFTDEARDALVAYWSASAGDGNDDELDAAAELIHRLIELIDEECGIDLRALASQEGVL